MLDLAITQEHIERLTPAQRPRVLKLAEELANREAQKLFFELFPDHDSVWMGPSIMGGQMQTGQILYARERYARHMEFFAASKEHRETCFMAANRVGKTFSGGGYATACHLTGLYPDWWPGRKFRNPVSWWAAGDTYETTRDIIQMTLLGEISYRDGRKAPDGRGVIPGHLLGRCTWRSGVMDLVDTIAVKHFTDGVPDGTSFLGLKSYDQGRKVFQGTARHGVWFDEEPPMDVYGEALVRTATVGGIVLLTFTPLLGLSQVVLSFMPADQRPEL